MERHVKQKHLNSLSSSEFFSILSEEVIQSLYASMQSMILEPEDILFEEGSVSDSLYFVISGRLLVTVTTQEKEKVIGQIGRGETVGEMGLISEQPRSATVTAIHKTHLLKLTAVDFRTLWEAHPEILFDLSSLITRRLQNVLKTISKTNLFSNVIIMPANESINIDSFVEKLRSNFNNKYRFTMITKNMAQSSLEMDNIEEQHDYIFYVVDSVDSTWTTLCLGRADRIIVIGDGSQTADLSPYCQNLFKKMKGLSRITKELVLLYPSKNIPPQYTNDWLSSGNYFRHHHLCINNDADYQRLIRFVVGKAVGFVFGGGGTRCWAHIGAYKAIDELGIPIDAVVGSSAGSLAAGLIAFAKDFSSCLEASKNVTSKMSTKEYTIPLVSLLSSKSFTNSFINTFGDVCIENLWTTMFCISVDINRNQEVIHRQSLLWQAVRASISIPGIFPPVIDGSRILVDGGIMNNLPVKPMRDFFEGRGRIIAIDVSELTEKETSAKFPNILTISEILGNKFFARYKHFYAPNIINISLKSLLASSNYQTKINAMEADIHIQLPVSGYSLLNFKQNEALFNIGYVFTKNKLKDWKQELDF